MRFRLYPLVLVAVLTLPARGEEARLSVPSSWEQATFLQQIQSKYQGWYQSPKKKDQVDLARQLFDAVGTAETPAQKFVLLSESRDAAARGNDFERAERSCAELVKSFNLSLASARVGYFAAGANLLIGRQEQDAYFSWLFKSFDDALMADDFAPAAQLLAQYDATAASTGNTAWALTAEMRRGDLVVQSKAYVAIKPPLETLRIGAFDSQATLMVGKYNCFIKGDWAKGLPMLMMGDDPELKQLARQELADPEDALAQVVIADGWYGLSQQIPESSNRIRLHAYDWYLRALPHLSQRDALDHDEEQISKLAQTASARGGMPEIWITVGDSVARASYQSTKTVGGAFGKEPFQSMAPNMGLLVGLRLGMGTFMAGRVINYVQPIYLTPQGEVLGQGFGRPTLEVEIVRAPSGYAIGAMDIQGGGGLDAVTVTFMRIRGRELDPHDTYVTPHIGGTGGGSATLNGGGSPVIGICGSADNQSGYIGLGLIFSKRAPAQFAQH
jgi:hypothetical protein